ncbi:hypothetical protein GQ54DRAFT_316783 [Martensiomyces pterosporus]|nr:hypothetical protein GQ54DRAFT_316783 [Martensiomyces pterosporus]
MRWMLVVDNTPLLWSSPCYFPQSTANQLAGQLPGYAKIKQMAGHSSERVPGKVLRQVFERSRSSLKTVNIPNGSALSDKNLSALLACKRPVLRHVSIYRAARLTDATITRVLNLVVPEPTTEIRLPYCEQVNGDVIKAIATHMPRLRVLDISGCMQVRMKDMFRAWGSTLTEMGDSTSLEELYLNDHPEMPRFLVYSMRHRHFSKLRTLHLAIRDQSVYSKVAGLGPLLTYFHNIANRQMPFPNLRELNLDGVWDATTSARRFEHAQVNELILHCRLFPSGLQELSALESSAVSDARLLAALQDCFSTLRRLHLTNARSPFSEVLGGLVDMLPAAVQFLPLTSLDLSGCVGLTAQALLALVSRCRDLVYINLSQTAANNAVLNKLRELAEMPESAGIEVLVLDTTDITGAAARDFAAACARRFRRRNDDRRISSAWRLRLLDMDNCVDVGSDAVAVVRDLLSPMGTRILAAVPG